MRAPVAVLLCLLCGLLIADSGGARAADAYSPGLAEASEVTWLGVARVALANAETTTNATDRRLQLATAIYSLTALLQLHGNRWALAPLQAVYADPDCPDLHVSYSADGRLSWSIEPLELQNPIFSEYTILLCTFESATADDLYHDGDTAIEIALTDGQLIAAEPLTPEHPLYEQLQRQTTSFHPPAALPAGAGIGFKQIFAVPELNRKAISAVLLEWGQYKLKMPYYENEVGSD
ncbi:hypothetical protein JW859_02200 [bacterium]|nr:hypothetical protein [bacterium]